MAMYCVFRVEVLSNLMLTTSLDTQLGEGLVPDKWGYGHVYTVVHRYMYIFKVLFKICLMVHMLLLMN